MKYVYVKGEIKKKTVTNLDLKLTFSFSLQSQYLKINTYERITNHYCDLKGQNTERKNTSKRGLKRNTSGHYPQRPRITRINNTKSLGPSVRAPGVRMKSDDGVIRHSSLVILVVGLMPRYKVEHICLRHMRRPRLCITTTLILFSLSFTRFNVSF